MSEAKTVVQPNVLESRLGPVLPDRERLTSSIASDTPELVSMRNQFEKGRPTVWYELFQNMVDYGKDPGRPPRAYIKYKDGSYAVFNGETIEDKEKVEEIHLLTPGSEMSPNYIVLFSHGGGQGTLGVHGRGGSIAYALLRENSQGVEISSNWQGLAYRGEIDMVEISGLPEKKQMVFNVEYPKGDWVEDSGMVTEIKIVKPTMKMVESLESLPGYFLPANPKYEKATAVEPRDTIPIETSCVVWEEEGGQLLVECLRGHKEKSDGDIYIGGLRLQHNYGRRFLWPWAIWGGEHFQNSDLAVTRSSDSRSPEGSYKQAIVLAVRRNATKQMLSDLLDANEEIVLEIAESPWYRGYEELDIGIPYGWDKEVFRMSDEVRDRLRACLVEKYGQMPVVTINRDIATQGRKISREPVLEVANRSLCELLVEAGCTRVESAYRVFEQETAGYLNVGLGEFDTVARSLEKLAAERGIRVSDGMLVINKADLSGFDEESFLSIPTYGTMESYLLIVAGYFIANGQRIEAKFIKDGKEYRYQFIGEKKQRDGTTRVEVSIECKVLITETQTEGDGSMSIEVGGGYTTDNTNQLICSLAERTLRLIKDVDNLEGLSPEELRKKIKELMDRKNRATKLGEIIAKYKEGGAASKTRLAWLVRGLGKSEATAENVRESGSYLGVFRERAGSDRTGRVFVVEANGIGSYAGGYYARGRLDRLVWDRSMGAKWENSRESFRPLLGCRREPSNWQVNTTIKLDKTRWTLVPVRQDMGLVTYKNQDGLEVQIDHNSGCIRARGVEDEVTFFQIESRRGRAAKRAGPSDIDREVHCQMEDLSPELQNELKEIRDKKGYSNWQKVLLVEALHSNTFVYNNDPAIQERVDSQASDQAKYEAALINESGGTCNYSATRAVLMTRLCGIPCRYVTGYISNGGGPSDRDSHAWMIFWDEEEKNWLDEEVTTGRIDPTVILEPYIYDQEIRLRNVTREVEWADLAKPDVVWAIARNAVTQAIYGLEYTIGTLPVTISELQKLGGREKRRQIRKDIQELVIIAVVNQLVRFADRLYDGAEEGA